MPIDCRDEILSIVGGSLCDRDTAESTNQSIHDSFVSSLCFFVETTPTIYLFDGRHSIEVLSLYEVLSEDRRYTYE